MATDLQSMDALLGMTQTGGKPKSRKTAKTSSNTMKKTTTGKKAVKAGSVKKSSKGGDVKNYTCFCFDPNIDNNMIKDIQNYQLKKQTDTDEDNANNMAQGLGIIGGMSRVQYKAYLAKMDVKKLYKIAKGKGIKITKKKDGKTTYIKKDTVVQKLCDAMHGKKK